MSSSVHITRQADDGRETPITLEEWNAFVEADPDLKRPEPGHLNYSETLVLLPSSSDPPDDWQWLSWCSGSISSDYPQQPMLRKIAQIARHFEAVVTNDEGEVWAIDSEGRVSIAGMSGARSGDASLTDRSTPTFSQPPPLPAKPEATAPQPWYLYIQRSGQIIDSEPAVTLLAEAIAISLEHYPASIPIADLEQACTLAERLKELGLDADVSGRDPTQGEQGVAPNT